MATKVLEAVTKALDDIKPPRGANYRTLFEIAKWQAAKQLAEKGLKEAWKTAQVEEGIIESDDALRAQGEGTRIVAEQGRFSATAKVSAPRKTLDQDALTAYLCRNHGMTPAQVVKAIESSKTEGTPPLEKRILEA